MVSLQQHGVQSGCVQDDSLNASCLDRNVSHLRGLGVVGIKRRAGNQEAGTVGLVPADSAAVLRCSANLMHEVIRAPEECARAVRRVVIRQVERVNSVREERQCVVQPGFKGRAAVKLIQTVRQCGVYVVVHTGVSGAERNHLVGIAAAVIRAEYLRHGIVADIQQARACGGVSALHSVAC